MVSILSFFTKKRQKTGSAEHADATHATPSRRAGSPTGTGSPPKSRAARTKSTRVPTTKAERRVSLEGYGLRRKSAASGLPKSTTPPRITIDLPFDFEGTAGASSAAGSSTLVGSHSLSLGLDAVGGTPTITPAERRLLDSQRYSASDLRAAWEWLGPQVQDRGSETVGIMLPRRFMANKDRQRQLAVLFVLARRPELASKFPTVTSVYPAPKEREAREVWKARLISVARDTNNPVDIAEALKSMLRRLAATDRPVIDPSVYVRFVQQEHAASYPRGAYSTMLLPQLDAETVGLLDAVLEVCNAIAMHAETNAMGAGRLCHLIGWWLLGKLPDGTSGWNALYDEYKLAGQRAEHLFYARIRYQSTQQKMPRRLVQLVLSYPFGESSASSEHLPLPPASTFSRKVLHVSLGTDAALPSGTDPIKVLGDAVIAKMDSSANAVHWQALRSRDGMPVTLEDLLSDDSHSFLDEVSSAKGMEITSQTQPARTPDEERYHPFANQTDRIVTAHNYDSSRRRSASYGDIPRLELGSSQPSLEAVAESGSPPRSGLARHGSEAQLSPTRAKAGPAWDDFEKKGFGESLEAVRDISLSLTKPRTPQKDPSSSHAPARKVIIRGDAPATNLLVAGEQVIDLDDAFIHFVEDGQLDPVASTSWPRFALVQLGEKVHSGDDEVDWLLVTVKKREHKPVNASEDHNADIRNELTRSMSPSNESTVSNLSSMTGLRDFANSFRRSNLGRSGSRVSFIHSTYSGKPLRGESLSPVKERPPNRISVVSEAETEYTIGEMGEMVKIPSAFELAAIASGGTVAGAAAAKVADPTLAAADEAARPIMATPASDWAYLAEGGAHVVFRYVGDEPSLQGRALRLQKVAKKGTPDIAVRLAWSDKLLPMIVPPPLLPETTPVALKEDWTRALVTPCETLRQSSRRAEGPLDHIVDYSRPAQIMDNLTAPIPGEKVLSLEIKPKWGFLPNASNLTPHESIMIKTRNCRYCLHQHYRGELTEDQYCPIDLYSGDQRRVRRALDGLWKAWRESGGEKNNLRVFVDGNKILPKDENLIPTNGEPLPTGSYDFVEPLLTSSSIMTTLKKLQSHLDPQDISSLAQDFTVAHPDSKLFAPELVPEATIPELTEFILEYKKGQTNWSLRQREIAYGLSAIFKDCSIILRAVLKPNGAGYELDMDKSVVNIIDTDLKPLASLGHWSELDDKLWRHWAETKGEPVVVVDAGQRDSLRADAGTPERTATPTTPVTPNEATAYANTGGLSPSPTNLAKRVTARHSMPHPLPLSLSQTSSLRRATSSIGPISPVPPSPVASIPDMEDANTALAKVMSSGRRTGSEDTETLQDEDDSELSTPVLGSAATRAAGPRDTATPDVFIEKSTPEETPPVVQQSDTLSVPSTPTTDRALSPQPRTARASLKPPKAIELPTGAIAVESPQIVSPISIVDPMASPGVEVPPEDTVDFDADPFAKAPLGLPRLESKTSLPNISAPNVSVPGPNTASAVNLSPSAANSNVNVANLASMGSSNVNLVGIASKASSNINVSGPGSKNSSTTSIPIVPLEKTQSRVKDQIQAIETADTDHKPIVPKTLGTSTLGVGVPKSDKGKKREKRGSFAAFVRKASATFERGKDGLSSSSSVKDIKAEAEKGMSRSASAANVSKDSKPFGSLRSKKKAAAAAGAAALAATVAVAAPTKEEKPLPSKLEAEAEPAQSAMLTEAAEPAQSAADEPLTSPAETEATSASAEESVPAVLESIDISDVDAPTPTETKPGPLEATSASETTVLSPFTAMERSLPHVTTAAEAMSPQSVSSAVSPMSPDAAMPESAVVPQESPYSAPTSLPMSLGAVSAAAAATPGLGLGLGLDSEEVLAEESTVEESKSIPITPRIKALGLVAASPDASAKGHSAVTPEFATTSAFSPLLTSASREEEEEHLRDDESTQAGSESTASSSLLRSDSRMKRSSAPSPSPHLAAVVGSIDNELEGVEEKAEPKSVRTTSPAPGPPEHVELYKNAELPPLPTSPSSGSVASTPIKAIPTSISSASMAARLSSDSHEVASLASEGVFATAPDTPSLSEMGEFDDAETPTVDLPELAAFTKRRAERRMSVPDDTPDEQRQGRGVLNSDAFRSSVHTFGGSPSEAAWLNTIAHTKTHSQKGLSTDDLNVPTSIPEGGVPTFPSSSTLATTALSSINDLAEVAEQEK